MNTKNASKECPKNLVTSDQYAFFTTNAASCFFLCDWWMPSWWMPSWFPATKHTITNFLVVEPTHLKHISKIVKHFPIFRWWKPKKHLSCHHLAPGEVEPKSSLSNKKWCFSQHLPLPKKDDIQLAISFLRHDFLKPPDQRDSTWFNVLLCWLHWFQSTMMAARNKQHKKHNKANPTKIL